MARRIKTTTAILMVDHAAGTFQVLNSFKVDDPLAPGLSSDDAEQPRAITGGELKGTLQSFIATLLSSAKTKTGI